MARKYLYPDEKSLESIDEILKLSAKVLEQDKVVIKDKKSVPPLVGSALGGGAAVAGVVGAGVTVGNAPGAAAEGKKIIEKSLRYLDVGGLLVTIGRLFRDINFITKVKEEFIHMELEKDIQAEIDELDQIYTIIKKASYI